MKKERHNPEKPQNNYGDDYECKQYECRKDGTEWCHDEGNNNWNECISWAKTDKNGKLICKGNRHNCFSVRMEWLASLSEQENKKFYDK